MLRIENECVGCGLPCVGDHCPQLHVHRYYCDKCGVEDTLYHFDGEEVCMDCITESLEVVEGSE